MKAINIILEDEDFEALKTFKEEHDITWRALVLRVLDEGERRNGATFKRVLEELGVDVDSSALQNVEFKEEGED